MLAQIILILGYAVVVALFVAGFSYIIKDYNYNLKSHEEKITRGVS